MITCYIDETNTIRFDMTTSGVTSGFEVYFTIVDETKRFSFAANSQDGQTYSVEVPVLKSLLQEGTYKCEINVAFGTKFFTPFTKMIAFISGASIPAIDNVVANDVVADDSSSEVEYQADLVAEPAIRIQSESKVKRTQDTKPVKAMPDFSMIKIVAEQASKTKPKINMMASINSVIKEDKPAKKLNTAEVVRQKTEVQVPTIKITRAEVIEK